LTVLHIFFGKIYIRAGIVKVLIVVYNSQTALTSCKLLTFTLTEDKKDILECHPLTYRISLYEILGILLPGNPVCEPAENLVCFFLLHVAGMADILLTSW